MKTLKASDVRENFSEIVSQAQYGAEPVIILRRGKKAAVIISYEEFLSYQESRAQMVCDAAAEVEYKTRKLAKKVAKAAPGWDTTKAIRKMRDRRWSS